MLLSDMVAQMIEQMLESSGGEIEIRRCDLADKFGCVPSQINYVITSRFTPERGYIIQSKRGGGGYVRIIKKQMHKNEYLMHFMYAIGDSIEEKDTVAFCNNLAGNGIISENEMRIICAALSEQALCDIPYDRRACVRARIFLQIILSLMR